jgi:hypothetical protein
METTMRVEFEYETQDRTTNEDVLLTVRGEVDLGTPAVLDRRPEHCEPGESATAEIDVTDPDGTALDAAEIAAKYQRTEHDLRAEAIAAARDNCRWARHNAALRRTEARNGR